MTSKTYRVAIIGLGRMGSTIDDELPAGSPPYSIAAACQASSHLQIVAGADTDADKRAAFAQRWGVPAVYADYVEMIRQEKPDLVAICTRGHLHAEMAARVAEEGVKLIFCEKAIACSLDEADAVLKAVQSNGALFNTGVLRRFNRRYHHARDLIRGGEIGTPLAAVHYARTNLLHGHIHSLDTLSFLLDDPKVESVWGELTSIDHRIPDNRLDEDPYGIFHVRYTNGITATTVPAGNWEFEVIGDKGSVRVLNNGESVQLRQSTPDSKRNFVEVAIEQQPDYSPTQSCLEDLIFAHEEGRDPLGHVDVTHHITETCIAIAESHRQGQRVTLPLQNRSMYIFHR